MTLAELLMDAARRAVNTDPPPLPGPVTGSDILQHAQEHRARAVTVAVLRTLADKHTIDAGTWWEQTDPIPPYVLDELADEIERDGPEPRQS